MRLSAKSSLTLRIEIAAAVFQTEQLAFPIQLNS